jgi:dihydroorotate dehydrogenase (fumarate)
MWEAAATIDLRTDYLGLALRCPLVASSSPLSEDLANLTALEHAGAGAVVLHSLFQEQIAPRVPRFGNAPWHALGAENFTIDAAEFRFTPAQYVDHVAAAKKSVSIPVIASLNVFSPDRWVEHARLIEQAGADALEIDIYTVETNLELRGEEIEQRYVEIVEAARSAVRIPIAVKLSPACTAPANLARRLVTAGADGLVLFNRFYQPTIDVDRRELLMQPVLSTSADALLPTWWITLLAGRIRASLAATGGIHTGIDALRAILAGANAVMMCSALLQNGIDALAAVRREMVGWMVDREIRTLDEIRGEMSLARNSKPEDFRRAGYMKVLQRY